MGIGVFDTVYCFNNNPYECEGLCEGIDVTFDGEFKCQICNFDSERLYVGFESVSEDDFDR